MTDENRGAVTQAEYGRMRGISRQRVNQLVKDGRIPVNADGLVDVAQADANMATMLDQRKANRDRQIALASVAPAGVVDARLDPDVLVDAAGRPLEPVLTEIPERPDASGPLGKTTGTSAATDYWEQKARRERIEADLADLKHRKAIGDVVDAEEVRRSRYETAYKVASALTQIPARVAPVIAPNDPMRAEKLLDEEIRRVINELSTDLDRGPGNAGGGDARAA